MKQMDARVGFNSLLIPQVINDTDTVSSWVDLANWNSAEILVHTGDFTGVDADSFLTIKLQESDTKVGTDFADVAAGNLSGAFVVVNATTKDSVLQKVGYLGTKRYIRVNLDFTTGTDGITSAPVSVTAVLGNPKIMPVSTPVTGAAT